MKRFLFFFFAISVHITFSQDKKLDGFFNDLNSYEQKEMDSLVKVVGVLWNKDLDSAEVIANHMLSHASEHKSERGLGQSYAALGGVYSFKGNVGKSIEYYIKSAKIFEQLGDEITLAKVNGNIGIGLLDQQQFEEARGYIKRAHDYYWKVYQSEDLNSKEIKFGFDLNVSYLTLAYLDIETNKSLEEIMSKLKKGEELAIKRKDTSMLSRILNLQGEAYLRKDKDFPFAISRIEKSLQLMKIKQPDNHFIIGYSYLFLGKGYWKMKDYKKAIIYNDSSLIRFGHLNYFKGLKFCYENRKEILDSDGKYEESIKVYKLFNQFKDSLFRKEQVNRISRMKIKYETDQIITQKEKVEQQVIISELENKKNRSLFIGSAVIAGLILLSSLFYFERIKAKKKAELIAIELKETQKRLAIEKQYRDSELKALKAQMNPHFIFNALNSIQDYIVLNQKNLASDYLGKFADLIRNYLHFSDTGFISIPDEVHNLSLYLELEKLRFEEVLEYVFQVDDNANFEAINIPTMLIQPYVENALKHGLLHKKDNRKLIISISKISDKVIECVIEDNGIGREKSREINQKRETQHKSFALKATTERLDLLNYGREKKIGVEIIDLKENNQTTGTKVILKIPILKKAV